MAHTGTMNHDKAAGHSGGRERVRMLVPPLVGGLALLVALLGLIGTAIRDPRPHDIPVGLVGPAPAMQQISTAFGSNAPGAFQFTTYASEADARAAVDSRAVDGVLVFAAGDAHGLILFFVVVAVIVSSLVAQAALLGTAPDAGFGPRLVVVLAFAVLGGLTAMGTAAWIADDYATGFWTATGLVMLAAAAVGAAVAGSARLLGPPGLGLAALVVVLLDLVSSGGPAGSQLLPDFYRWLAPWMPAGQLYSGLRGALYFGGAGLESPLIVLGAWLGGGLVLMGLGELVAARRGAQSTAAASAPA